MFQAFPVSTKLLLLLEVETDVEIKRTEGVVEAHLLVVMVEGVEDERCAGIPLRVVIDEAQTPDEVDAEVVVAEVEETVQFGLGNVLVGILTIDIHDVVGDGRRERRTDEPVAAWHPVVCIAEVDAVVVVLDFVEVE